MRNNYVFIQYCSHYFAYADKTRLMKPTSGRHGVQIIFTDIQRGVVYCTD